MRRRRWRRFWRRARALCCENGDCASCSSSLEGGCVVRPNRGLLGVYAPGVGLWEAGGARWEADGRRRDCTGSGFLRGGG